MTFKNGKIIFLVLFSFLFVCGVMGYLYLSKSINNIENWKTYSSKKVKVSFKYPPEYTYHEDDNLNSGYGFTAIFNNGNNQFNFSIYPSLKGMQTYQPGERTFISGDLSWQASGLKGCDSSKNRNNTGIYAPPCMGSQISYVLYKNDWRYEFLFFGTYNEDYTQKQIISSFRITP